MPVIPVGTGTPLSPSSLLGPGGYEIVDTLHPSAELWPSPLLFPGTVPTAEVQWAPTLQDVASKVLSYTVERLGEEQADPDADYATFTEKTKPKAMQVALMIAAAIAQVAGFVGLVRGTNDPFYEEDPTGLQAWGDMARETASWLVAMSIERDRIPAQSDDAAGAYSAAEAQYEKCLRELADQARRYIPRLT